MQNIKLSALRIVLISLVTSCCIAARAGDSIVVRITDDAGKPVAGAVAAVDVKWLDVTAPHGHKPFEAKLRHGSQPVAPSDARGTMQIPADAMLNTRAVHVMPASLFIMQEKLKLGA